LNPEYYMSLTAGSPLLHSRWRAPTLGGGGIKRSLETRNLISKVMGTPVYVYQLLPENTFELVSIFVSARKAAEFLSADKDTVMKYARSGQLFRGKYRLSLDPL